MKHNWKFSVSCRVWLELIEICFALYLWSHRFRCRRPSDLAGFTSCCLEHFFFINLTQHWLSLAACYFSWQSPKLLSVTLVFCDLLVLSEIHVLQNSKKRRPKTAKCLTGCSFCISCSLFPIVCVGALPSPARVSVPVSMSVLWTPTDDWVQCARAHCFSITLPT